MSLPDPRAREFDLLFGLLNDPERLRIKISENDGGRRYSLEGIVFEFGNVSRLASSLSVSTFIRPFTFKPKFACHVVNIGVQRKIEIEQEFGLIDGSLSSKSSKVNLFLVDAVDRPYFISYRLADSQAKLGQISTSKTYLNGHLHGGLWGAEDKFKVPLNIDVSDTALDDITFQKLNRQNKMFAYIKKAFPTEWKAYCEIRLQEATQQVIDLGEKMIADKNEFIEFIEQTFAGPLSKDPNFYMLIGDQVVHFSSVIEKLRKSDFKISTDVYKPKQKVSLVINIELNGEKYCVTKIEPSFDGQALNAEQTKGIIYYFQQHQKDGNNYKKLLLDISE